MPKVLRRTLPLGGGEREREREREREKEEKREREREREKRKKRERERERGRATEKETETATGRQRHALVSVPAAPVVVATALAVVAAIATQEGNRVGGDIYVSDTEAPRTRGRKEIPSGHTTTRSRRRVVVNCVVVEHYIVPTADPFLM